MFYLKKIVPLFLISTFFYVLHKIIIYSFNINIQNYSLEFVYAFFNFTAIFIYVIMLFLKHKKIDSIGFVFLALTNLQMGVAYILLQYLSILTSKNIEKWNILFVCLLFLSLETFFCAQLLNQKEKQITN